MLPSDRVWDAGSPSPVGRMALTVPTTGTHCFKKSVHLKIVTQKPNYLMSKEWFTSPVNALEEKAPGPRPGRGRREQSHAARPPAEKTASPS